MVYQSLYTLLWSKALKTLSTIVNIIKDTSLPLKIRVKRKFYEMK